MINPYEILCKITDADTALDLVGFIVKCELPMYFNRPSPSMNIEDMDVSDNDNHKIVVSVRYGMRAEFIACCKMIRWFAKKDIDIDAVQINQLMQDRGLVPKDNQP